MHQIAFISGPLTLERLTGPARGAYSARQPLDVN